MDGDVLAFSKRVFQTQTAKCLKFKSQFSVFSCCMSYYLFVRRVMFTVLYTRVYVVKPMGHGSCIMGHGSVFVWVTG